MTRKQFIDLCSDFLSYEFNEDSEISDISIRIEKRGANVGYSQDYHTTTFSFDRKEFEKQKFKKDFKTMVEDKKKK